MIKGINHSVIEIKDTGSVFFERALLFVRPEKQGENPAHLEASARGLLRKATLRRNILLQKALLTKILGYILALALGAGITALLLL
jgi:hypothetical protein